MQTPKYFTHCASIVFISAILSTNAMAGVYTDDLSKCLVAKSTDAEKLTLMKWIFSAISLNPTVAPMANISPEQRKKINADVAELYQTLLTETCRTEVQIAVKNEGTSALEASFQVLGEVAGRGLFSSPEVSKGMEEMQNMIDKDKVKAVFAAPTK